MYLAKFSVDKMLLLLYNMCEYNAQTVELCARLCIIEYERTDRMKKTSFRILSLALSLILALSCVVGAAAFEGRYGDTDGKGTVDSTDALAILLHAVDKKKLSADALLRADVNADTFVNSSDALEVLLFTVGRVTKFKAETIAPPEAPEKEVLGLYAAAVDKMYEVAPFYRLRNEVEPIDIKTSGTIELPKESLDEMMGEKSVNKSVHPLGSNSAKLNLPTKFPVDDISKFKSVEYEKLDTGEYKLIIRFKDEVNPTKDSYLVKNFGFPDAATIKASMESEFDNFIGSLDSEFGILGFDAVVKITIGDVKYQNVYVTCIFNPETNEFISYDFIYDTSVSINASIALVGKLNMEMINRSTSSYTDIRYTEEA